MNRKLFVLGLIVCFLFSCEPKPYEGKYFAVNGFLLEWIKIWPDNTADMKYIGVKDEISAKLHENNDTIIIKELNREWAFRRSGDTLFEISRNDHDLILVRPPHKEEENDTTETDY